jgi:hypothetical protein
MPSIRWDVAGRVIAAAIGCAALAGCDPPAARLTQAPGACQLTLLADLPAQVVGGVMLVPVLLDGKAAEMSLDVEPSATYVTNAAVARLGLIPIGNHEAAHIRHFAMGAIRVGDLDLGAAELSPNDYYPQYRKKFDAGWSGNIGPTVLFHYDVEFDLAHRHVLIYQHNDCHGSMLRWSGPVMAVHYEPVTYHPYANSFTTDLHEIRLPVRVNGTDGFALLFSAGPTAMGWAAANRFGISRSSPGVQQLDAGTNPALRRYPMSSAVLTSLEVGGETLHNVPVMIYARSSEEEETHRLMHLGIDFFAQNRVYIAYADHTLYFTPNAMIAAGH